MSSPSPSISSAAPKLSLDENFLKVAYEKRMLPDPKTSAKAEEVALSSPVFSSSIPKERQLSLSSDNDEGLTLISPFDSRKNDKGVTLIPPYEDEGPSVKEQESQRRLLEWEAELDRLAELNECEGSEIEKAMHRLDNEEIDEDLLIEDKELIHLIKENFIKGNLIIVRCAYENGRNDLLRACGIDIPESILESWKEESQTWKVLGLEEPFASKTPLTLPSSATASSLVLQPLSLPSSGLSPEEEGASLMRLLFPLGVRHVSFPSSPSPSEEEEEDRLPSPAAVDSNSENDDDLAGPPSTSGKTVIPASDSSDDENWRLDFAFNSKEMVPSPKTSVKTKQVVPLNPIFSSSSASSSSVHLTSQSSIKPASVEEQESQKKLHEWEAAYDDVVKLTGEKDDENEKALYRQGWL